MSAAAHGDPGLRQAPGARTPGALPRPQGALFRAFRVTGLPASFLIDPDGAILGAYAGPAEWNGPEPRALIEYYLNRPEHAADPAAAGG